MNRLGGVGPFILGLLALALYVRAIGAQETNCERRLLQIALRDQQDLPIQNISATDFEARVHGKPIKILSLAPDPRPHRIVLILDTSGSMSSTAAEPALVSLEFSLARHFFELNRQRSQIALLTFNNGIKETVDFPQGNAAVGSKLQQIASDRNYVKANVKGTTALRDAIMEGLQLLVRPNSADALYILTDGGDNASKHSAADLTKRVKMTSARLFVVLLHREAGSRNRTPEELTGPDELSEIARKSGGEILTAAAWHGDKVALSANSEVKLKSQETLSRLYEAIFQDYLLEVELPSAILKDERLEVKLSETAHRKWKRAQITYPTILISCNSEISGSGNR